ncbi:MAG: SWIM zinc finger family protein, partial [Actinocatenispora sp.]
MNPRHDDPPASGGTSGRRDGPTLTVPARAPEPRRHRFGGTWWGTAWLAALETQAELDPNRLPRGRTYARNGAVGDTVLRPGGAEARVRGRRPEPYRVRVAVTAFDDAQWDRILDAVAGQVGHAAALLDGEFPPEVDEDVRRTGLSLLPGPHEVTVSCSCPDRAVPCKHAAAVCYVLCDVLDADPFALLLLRGRGRAELLDELRARRGAGTAGPPPA